MNKKQFVIFGLGRFGKSVATTLSDNGCDVLVIDADENSVNEMADYVTYAVKADATDTEALKSLGISNFDVAIIAMGENLEASVMATIFVKEVGVPYVLAKAQNDLQGRILKKLGADMVVYPEKETGVRIANSLLINTLFDAVELPSNYSMMELDALPEWIGKSFHELDLRARLKINVIGIKSKKQLNINPDPDEAIAEGDVLILIGKNEVLNKLALMHKKVEIK
ncbi:potassium channel family protein [Aminipila terrae]|uniref:TrkA family potassium uptake protein n=1 Tax=Aminipila terrae TaxID=2697030 RepID=A0A6P1MJJ5_9FIRM|nr:TrkA family potassium uptake protein [Aminipila terrae]QHI73373.1 TrkA family potassium uptake protein [Aminipila terrae]